MIRQAEAHYLRGNKGERTPRRLIVLDTESKLIETGPREVMALRCYVLRYIEREPGPGSVTECVQFEGEDGRELAPLVESRAKSGKGVRLFTHNLSFDLGLTKLPLELIERGWSVGQHNLASDQPWAHLSKASRSLWLCDSWSWLPTSIERLAELQGRQKAKLPGELDSAEAWMHRCRLDVEILSSALLELMAEWDRRALGWWSITGPASGWNTFLHFPRRTDKPNEVNNAIQKTDPHAHTGNQRFLIVPDAQARAFERQALYSGRRDLWQAGRLKAGPYAEIDLKQAHLSICAAYPLPFRRWKAFGHLELDDWRVVTSGAGLLAEVVVNSHTPRYPCRIGGAVLHPVGTFKTVLAGPEIRDALARGELLSIGQGYGYHLGRQMRGWATWALAVLNSEPGEVSPMLQVAVKGWSRSVPGRWAMTHAREIKSGPSSVKTWGYEPITIGSPPRRGSIFHLAGTWHESIHDEEAEDSFPAVLAYVQSYCRLALNRILDALPEWSLVSCNTEGAWVTQTALATIGLSRFEVDDGDESRATFNQLGTMALSESTAPLEVQLKRTAQSLTVLSPQHHRTEQERLYSGIPRTAAQVDAESYQFWTWPKLKGQIEKGDPRGYVRHRRTVNLSALTVPRWMFEDGACEPVEVSLDAADQNSINPPSEELRSRHGALRPLQHPVLRSALAGK